MVTLTDNSLFPYGSKYKGIPMCEVDAEFLLDEYKFWTHQAKKGKMVPDHIKSVLHYVQENMEYLQSQV